ncbi:hypothetical protein PTKIN_Ptkin06aG0077600 [Pterospermum kingtungense]
MFTRTQDEKDNVGTDGLSSRLDLEDENSFSKATFWVLVYYSPLNLTIMEIIERIGNKIGTLKSIDHNPTRPGWGRNLRLRVEVDISKPLRQFVTIPRGRGRDAIWGRIGYERLPTFCYTCGRIGHVEFKCSFGSEVVNDGAEKGRRPATLGQGSVYQEAELEKGEKPGTEKRVINGVDLVRVESNVETVLFSKFVFNKDMGSDGFDKRAIMGPLSVKGKIFGPGDKLSNCKAQVIDGGVVVDNKKVSLKRLARSREARNLANTNMELSKRIASSVLVCEEVDDEGIRTTKQRRFHKTVPSQGGGSKVSSTGAGFQPHRYP